MKRDKQNLFKRYKYVERINKYINVWKTRKKGCLGTDFVQYFVFCGLNKANKIGKLLGNN